MKIKPSSYFLLFLMALMVAVIGLSLTFNAWESKMLPIVIAAFVLLLGVIQLRKEVSAKEIDGRKTSNRQTKVKGASLISVLGWIFGFPLAIYFIGFFVAIPIFVLSFVKQRGRSWVASITIAVVTTAAVYVIFELGLRADLWKGLIFISLL